MSQTQVPRIFERSHASAKWARARGRQQADDAANYLAQTIAEDIAERLEFMQLEVGKALLVGDIGGHLQAALHAAGWDGAIGNLGEFEEEQPGPQDAFDLVVHMLGLGMVNDLPGALIHARNSLREDGLFIAAFPGAGSLPALRRIVLAADGDRPAARIHPQIDNRAGTGLLQRALFKRQVVDSFPIEVRFSSLERLVEDLRDHGLTASLSSPAPPLTREWLSRARAEFDAMREEDGKVTERFEILVLTGWR